MTYDAGMEEFVKQMTTAKTALASGITALASITDPTSEQATTIINNLTNVSNFIATIIRSEGDLNGNGAEG